MRRTGLHTTAAAATWNQETTIMHVEGLRRLLEEPTNWYPQPGRGKKIVRQLLVGLGIMTVLTAGSLLTIFL